MNKKYRKKLILKKSLLNFLLGYLSPSNKLVIYLSQDLDKLISKYQKGLYVKYKRKNSQNICLKKAA